MKLSRRFLLPIIVIVVAIAVAGFLRATRPEIERQPPQERVWPVAALRVAHSNAQPAFRVYGEVVAGREVELRALVVGVVVETSRDLLEGGIVKKGDLILAIDEFDFRTQLEERRAQAREARAKLGEIEARHRGNEDSLGWDRQELKLLKRDYDRAREATRQGKCLGEISRQCTHGVNEPTPHRCERQDECRDRGVTYGAAALDYQTPRCIGASSRARAQRDQAYLRRSTDSYIQSRLPNGKRLSINDRVAKLVDANRLDVRVHLSNLQFGRLIAADEALEGRTVQIVWQLGEQRFSYDAVIERVGARIDATTGGVELFARIQSGGIGDDFVLARSLTFACPSGVIKTSSAPLKLRYTATSVYAIVEQRLQRRAIEVVAQDGNSVLLRGNIRDGEQIVTTRFPEIAPGLKVEVR